MSLEQQMQGLHGGLTGKLTKCVQYGINDLYVYRPGFYVPDISGSSRTVNKFVQVVTYRTLAKQADGQKITYCTDICLPKQLTVSARITVQLRVIGKKDETEFDIFTALTNSLGYLKSSFHCGTQAVHK